MFTRKSSLVFILAILLVFTGTAHSQIFNNYEYSDGYTPTTTYEENRTISGAGGANETLSFRLNLYGTASANMPLLVQVHEWGGDFARMEDLASYIPSEYSFVMLSFQYQPSTNNEDDWWFGTYWDGECHMWAHQAVMSIVREAINTSLVSGHLAGVTINRNRVYLFGHSIGGTGAWQLGVRNPDVFAAVHAHSGFARFTPPVGPFQGQFERDIVGTAAEGVILRDSGGTSYSARDYSNLFWWLQNYRNSSYETPFFAMTAGAADTTVPAASGADLMQPVFDDQRRAFFYFHHSGDHSDACLVQMNWLWNFRLNQSFLAFTNRSGYGAAPGAIGNINDLNEFSWDPSSIVDRVDRYEVQLVGSGTADVTPRRLQNFNVQPGGTYTYWLDGMAGAGTSITADANGLLTIPSVSGSRRIIITPSGTPPPPLDSKNNVGPITLLLSEESTTPPPPPPPSEYNTDPPSRVVKLIFIHHSCGGYWLSPTSAENGGQLGDTLEANNYFVSDTDYGWGPPRPGFGMNIGDFTDIGHWHTWFRGGNSAAYLQALYTDSEAPPYFTRNLTNPGGENQIVMFKSCYPNSNLSGSASENPPPISSNPLVGEDVYSPAMTVANAKGIYIDLLEYFRTMPNKLFIVVTAPPNLDDGENNYGPSVRAFNNWLVNDWLDDYSLNNVQVFDFYNVLTSNGGAPDANDLGSSTGNHHRLWDNQIQHLQTVNNNYTAYESYDAHPSSAGNQKATAEYGALLNIYYHCWQGSGACPGR